MTSFLRTSFKTPSMLYPFLVLCLCLEPLVLNLWGIDFSSVRLQLSLEGLGSMVPKENVETNLQLFRGVLSHSVLEVIAMCAAIFTAILSLTHFKVNRDVATPILGIALLCAGSMDVFTLLAGDRLIHILPDVHNFLPFTWVMSRTFYVSILMLWMGFFLYYPRQNLKENSFTFTLIITLFCAMSAYALIEWAISTQTIPQMQFPNAFITRPYDLIPLSIFLFIASVVYYRFYKAYKGVFTYALMLSLIPQVFTEFYMVFGSSHLYDNFFNIAHFLKIFSYLIPFIGLCVDYVFTYQTSQRIQGEMGVKNTELDLALNRAQRATQAKSDFLASMTHELRTPMNGVIGMANLLGEGKLSSEQKQQVNIVKSCAHSLLIVINDILDFSKIEAGKMTVEIVPFNLKKMCMDTIDLVRFQAESKDLSIDFQMAENVPLYVKGDPNRLRQILLNFLSNAIKFTLQGTISLKLSYHANTLSYRFAVQDTGVGIPEHVADELFQPFSQADTSTSRKFGGTGLGLAISRKLSQLMEGRVWLESVEGEGATFYLALPLSSAQQEEVNALEATAHDAQATLERHELSILLAEDNQVNQMVALSVLKKIGYSADVANDGLEVLEALDKQDYDLIFMDMMMPEMDGVTATKEICQRFKVSGKQKPRIVAMTANAMEADRQRCLRAGMDGFMSKPVALSDLKRIILETPKITQGAGTREAIGASNLTDKKESDACVFSHFESEKLLNYFEEDQDMIPDMIDIFLKSSLDYMAGIDNAIEARNGPDLQLSSHTLKGSFRTFYADKAVEIAQALESLGKEQSFDNARALYEELKTEMPLLTEELTQFKEKIQ